MPSTQMERRDPRTKEELLNRLLSYDFNGDLRHLGDGMATIVRTAKHKTLLRFTNGQEFELVVRKPNESRRKQPAPEARKASPRIAAEPRTFSPTRDEDEWTIAPTARKRAGIRPDART